MIILSIITIRLLLVTMTTITTTTTALESLKVLKSIVLDFKAFTVGCFKFTKMYPGVEVSKS